MSEQPAVKVLMLKGEKGNQGNGISEEEMEQINSKIDSSVASAEKSIEEGLENRLAEMKFVPVVLANADEIKSKYPNGADGLFIAGDTGHLWVFVSGNWKDCGQYQTAGLSSEVTEKINNSIKGVGFNINSTDDLVAPYDSLNTLPLNSVVTYGIGIKENVRNAPSEFTSYGNTGATVITYSAKYSGGAVQILVSPAQELYYRICWGYPETWENWVRIASLDAFKSLDIVAPYFFNQNEVDSESMYKDLNNLVNNQVVTYALTDMSKIKNAPSDKPGTLITYSTGRSDGRVQVFITSYNETFQRISWAGEWDAWKKQESYKPAPSLAMFQKIGIVGDSYASGELAFDGNYTDHYEISWGQVLARKNGAVAVNFSKGGLTTQSWLTSPKGLSLLNSSDAQDLYICALGINDSGTLGESYIGSESDIDSGADTFYGNYGKIIKAIQSKAPNAKIVISTLANSSELSQKFNSAIETISKHFGIALIKQSDDPFFTSDYYLKHMQWGHPTGPVYAEMANAIERLISQQMVDNLSYFETYKK